MKVARALSEGRPVPDEVVLSVVRKWFWSRRSGRGFLLQGFPATLRQALVFDEWLEARGESLERVLLPVSPRTPVADEVVSHYESQAILARFRPENCDDGRLHEEPAVVLAGR